MPELKTKGMIPSTWRGPAKVFWHELATSKMRPGAAGGKPVPIRQYMRDEMFTLAGRADKELATERAGSTPGQGARSFPLCGDNRSSAEPAATTWRNTCPTLGRLTAALTEV